MEEKKDDNEYSITLYMVDKHNKEIRNIITIVLKDLYIAEKVKDLLSGIRR